jgi:predicted transcriptional regulator
MKVMSIRIKSREDSWNDFKDAWKKAARGTAVKEKAGVYFTSLESVRNFLTPKRLELLHIIKVKKPQSLSDLARLTGRSFPSVFRDVDTLTRHGLVTLSKKTLSIRSAVCPRVDYDELDLKIAV